MNQWVDSVRVMKWKGSSMAPVAPFAWILRLNPSLESQVDVSKDPTLNPPALLIQLDYAKLQDGTFKNVQRPRIWNAGSRESTVVGPELHISGETDRFVLSCWLWRLLGRSVSCPNVRTNGAKLATRCFCPPFTLHVCHLWSSPMLGLLLLHMHRHKRI